MADPQPAHAVGGKTPEFSQAQTGFFKIRRFIQHGRPPRVCGIAKSVIAQNPLPAAGRRVKIAGMAPGNRAAAEAVRNGQIPPPDAPVGRLHGKSPVGAHPQSSVGVLFQAPKFQAGVYHAVHQRIMHGFGHFFTFFQTINPAPADKIDVARRIAKTALEPEVVLIGRHGNIP